MTPEATITNLLLSLKDHPEPLDRLTTLRKIRDAADSSLPDAVATARDADWSWTDLGRALGTTRQAAWERYNP